MGQLGWCQLLYSSAVGVIDFGPRPWRNAYIHNDACDLDIYFQRVFFFCLRRMATGFANGFCVEASNACMTSVLTIENESCVSKVSLWTTYSWLVDKKQSMNRIMQAKWVVEPHLLKLKDSSLNHARSLNIRCHNSGQTWVVDLQCWSETSRLVTAGSNWVVESQFWSNISRLFSMFLSKTSRWITYVLERVIESIFWSRTSR